MNRIDETHSLLNLSHPISFLSKVGIFFISLPDFYLSRNSNGLSWNQETQHPEWNTTPNMPLWAVARAWDSPPALLQ